MSAETVLRPRLYRDRRVLRACDLAAFLSLPLAELQHTLAMHLGYFPPGTVFSVPWTDLLWSSPSEFWSEDETGESLVVFTETGAVILAMLLRPRFRPELLLALVRAYSSVGLTGVANERD